MSIKTVTTEHQKRTARYAKAMGHPVRMYVLELLSNQSCCYSGDLRDELPIAKSTLSLPEIIILKKVLKWQRITVFEGIVAIGIV